MLLHVLPTGSLLSWMWIQISSEPILTFFLNNPFQNDLLSFNVYLTELNYF